METRRPGRETEGGSGGRGRWWQYALCHHPRGEWDRCFVWSVRGRAVPVCSRCLGLYPVSLAVLVVACALDLEPPHVGMAMVAASLPAYLDWLGTRLGVWRSTNWVRLVTGGIAGVGLGLALAVHIRRPWTGDLKEGFVGLAAMVLTAAWIELLGAGRR